MDTQEQLKTVNKELEDKIFQRNLLYNVENELTSLNTNIKHCISLIASSVKGKKANEIINNLTEENKKLTDQCNHTILEDKQKLNTTINELTTDQNLLQEKIRKEEEEEKKKKEEEN